MNQMYNNSSNEISSLIDTRQALYLSKFIKSYNGKREASKAKAQEYRSFLCNNRKSSSGFRIETKELTYPIIASKSYGSKIWDIDENEYIDLSMGYGANLFGHKPSFLQKALKEQINKGYQLGPEAEYAGECAKLISELSNKDRVLFCNSGTEAVMTAIRIARAFRKKDKIVVFQNSYHGHYDSTLVINDLTNPKVCKALHIGIPKSLVEDMILLPYADYSSLNTILKLKDKIAAVLIEPVQNSSPDFHPKDFLKELRKVTFEQDISLIFDEVLVGFRISMGGAQQWFEVDADIVTYGKIVGGGLPIGVVAGNKVHMDIVDGGMWEYGDFSKPSEPTTFTAGTFCKHPLAMAACYSTLKHIKQKSHELYIQLNERSANLFQILNDIFNYYAVPIKVCSFGSFFRFSQDNNLSFVSQPLELDIFFYHLIDKGVYVWECKTCFITTAHTNKDFDKIIKSVQESIIDMKTAGFWPKSRDISIHKEFSFFFNNFIEN